MGIAAVSEAGDAYDVNILPTGGEFFHDQPSEWTFLTLSINGASTGRSEELVTWACESERSRVVLHVESLDAPVTPAIVRVRSVCLLESDDPEDPGWWIGTHTWLVQAETVLY